MIRKLHRILAHALLGTLVIGAGVIIFANLYTAYGALGLLWGCIGILLMVFTASGI